MLKESDDRKKTFLKIKIPAKLVKIEKNSIIKDYISVKNRNDIELISFSTTIFKKLSNENNKNDTGSEKMTIIKTHDDISNINSAIDKINDNPYKTIDNDNKIKNILHTSRTQSRAINDVKKEMKKLENIKNKKLDVKYSTICPNESSNYNLNSRYKYNDNCQEVKIKNIYNALNLVEKNNSLNILPKQHRKGYSTIVNQNIFLNHERDTTFIKMLPELKLQNVKKESQNFLKNNETIYQRRDNIINLKKQLYNKFFSISRLINDKRTTDEKEKTDLKLKIHNYSEYNDNQSMMNKKKFISTAYMKGY